jgi:hypothetical protein
MSPKSNFPAASQPFVPSGICGALDNIFRAQIRKISGMNGILAASRTTQNSPPLMEWGKCSGSQFSAVIHGAGGHDFIE